MSTSATTHPATLNNHAHPAIPHQPRVWLVAGGRTPDPQPNHLPAVRDDLMHIWRPGDDGLMHMAAAGHDHHTTWRELRARFDLVEVA